MSLIISLIKKMLILNLIGFQELLKKSMEEKMQSMLKNADKKSKRVIDHYISASQKSYHDMTEHIDMINKFDTKKSVIFENIDNMTGQLEPLLKEEI